MLALEKVDIWYSSVFSSTMNFLGTTENQRREGWREGKERDKVHGDKEEREKGRGGKERRREKKRRKGN